MALNMHAAAAALLLVTTIGSTAFAQKQGGTLRVHEWDSPPSCFRSSLHGDRLEDAAADLAPRSRRLSAAD